MKILAITGDKNFGPGEERFELQRSVMDDLQVVYWGRGSGSWRIWPKIPAGKFDVVTAQDPFFRGLFAAHATKKLGAKLQVQVHADLAAQSFLRRLLARTVLRRADGIRVVSEKIKAQVQALGVRAPISVLPIFVDLTGFKNAVRAPHEGKNILWIGRFEEEKDPFAAISVFEKVRMEIPEAKLIMLGKGSLEAQLKERTKNLPVEFPGWVDTISYLEKADVVLSTSRHESWGASIVESLAAGVPVVAPDVGVAKEAGAIVVPKQKLADAVIEILHHPQPAELKLALLDAEEWTREWYKGLSK